MAKIIPDSGLKKLFGSVIENVDESCLRPNSYILRLGREGEFLNTEKAFELKGKFKGIKVQTGHSVGVTALEKINFSRETVQKHYPDCNLHGLLSPTTDLSREGIVAPTTQIDAGYSGTLNWTITNTSSKEARFIYGERIFRLTIFLLERGENPDSLYSGDYNLKEGYVRSHRSGAPMSMKDSEWENAFVKNDPADKFEELIKSGYPYNLLGSRLKEVDEQFKTVTEEYAEIHTSINSLNIQVNKIREKQKETPETVRKVLREETGALQNRWLIGTGSLILATTGIGLSASSNTSLLTFIREHAIAIGLITIVMSAAILILISRKK